LLSKATGPKSLEDQVISALGPKHVATAVTGPQVLQISYVGAGPAIARSTLQAIVTGLEQDSASLGRRHNEVAVDYYRSQVDAAAKTVGSLRDQIAAYQSNWHRGTPAGLELARAYCSEVEERAARGMGAYQNERVRLLYWSMMEQPDFHTYMEERYGAVFVAAPYGAAPQTYARTVYDDDPLRALSARHIFLFDMTSTSWMLNEAQLHGVDAVVGVEDPSPYPSRFRQACEAAGLRYIAVPRVSDDPEVRAILDRAFHADQ
jgi:hypothetical protein